MVRKWQPGKFIVKRCLVGGWVGGDNGGGVEVAFHLNYFMSVPRFELKGTEDMHLIHSEGEIP